MSWKGWDVPGRNIRRQLGTNFHLDSFRPWLSGDRVERHLPAIAARFEHVRIVGDPLLPSPDGADSTDPHRAFERLLGLCREHGLSAFPLCWNVVSDDAAALHPLVDRQGRTFPRGHWGLFNFSDPDLREISLRSLETLARQLVPNQDVITDFQPTNEWLLTCYLPHGWSWPAYAGEMRNTATQVMYDPHSMARWRGFLAALDPEWQEGIAAELGLDDVTQAQPPVLDAEPRFSAHDLAWARFRSSLIGDYLVDVYERVKPRAADMNVLSQSAMPVPLTRTGLEAAALGHNPEYWLKRGRSCDVLAVNTYDSNHELPVYPEHVDNRLEHRAWMMYFQELVRAYGLQGLSVSEQGGNSFTHSDEGQRYVAMRGALSAASFDLDLHTHLLWNDEPGFEPVHEQFFGIVRDQDLQPKPAAHEMARVRWLLRRVGSAALRPDPQVYAVLPRESMDLGLEGWSGDVLSGSRRHVAGVTTDTLLADRGVPETTRALVFAGRHLVSSGATLEAAARVGCMIVIWAGAAAFGVDDDATRRETWARLTGLKSRPAETTIGDVTMVWSTDTAGADRSSRLRGPRRILSLSRADLPPGAHVLCSIGGDGSVLAYRHVATVVSALPVGRDSDSIDPDLSHWTRVLLDSSIGPVVTLPFDVAGDDELLDFHVVGDILTVVNPGPDTGRATIAIDEGRTILSVDVAPGHFSAVQLAREPEVAILSGVGAIAVNGRTLVESGIHAVVLADTRGTRVEPLHGPLGERISEVTVNGRAAQCSTDSGNDVWIAPIGLPVRVGARRQRASDSRAVYRRELPVTEHAVTRGMPDHRTIGTSAGTIDTAGRHSLFRAPGEAWIEWRRSPGDPTSLRIAYRWWSAATTAEGSLSREITLETSGGRVAVPVPTGPYPVLVQCEVEGGAPHGGGATLVYQATDVLDTVTSSVGSEMIRHHFLHPLRWERYDIVEADAEVVDDAGHRHPVNLAIGYRGMHGRHLQWSEDWVDFSVQAD